MNNKDYVLDKVLNTQITVEPWKHLIIKDFLPNNFYNAVKQEISNYLENPT